MSRMNRRQFTWIATGGLASATLVACSGEAVTDDLTPTQIPDVQGAPPTLAPQATPFQSEEATPVEEAPAEEQAAGGGEPIRVAGLDTLRFDPESFEASPGQTILFVNEGSLPHNFIVEELGIDMPQIPGGEEQEVAVPEDAEPGDYEYICSVPGHAEAGMVGTMTVVEAGGGEEAASADDEATPVEEEAAVEEESAASAGGGEPIRVAGLDTLRFDPESFEASPGQTILFVNEGSLPHNFIVDELGIDMPQIPGGEEQEVVVPDDAEPGDYEYICSVPGHAVAGMVGTMTVV